MFDTAALTFCSTFAFIAQMRAVLFLVCAVVFSGCAHSKVEKKTGGTRKNANSQPVSVTRPVVKGAGIVLSVSDSLRFVVIDYSAGEVPPLNSRLNVYRAGQKVAELNLSGPVRGNNVVADIRAGEVKTGDEVRVD